MRYKKINVIQDTRKEVYRKNEHCCSKVLALAVCVFFATWTVMQNTFIMIDYRLKHESLQNFSIIVH
jgi:hypothetical protein